MQTYGAGFTNAAATPLLVPDIRPWTSCPSALLCRRTNTTSASPFPWLTWNNRPYASPTELLLVPRLSSSRLLRDFSTCSPTPARLGV